MDWTTIGERVRNLRAESDLTQSALADSAGTHGNTIWNLEHGRAVKLSTLERVADALGVGVAFILGHSASRRASRSTRRRARGAS